MKELTQLRSMWAPKIRRKVELIVPNVTFDGKNGSLNNDMWAFRVPFSFREALDISFDERKKNKKAYMIWTQGPILKFKEGDLLHTKDGKYAIQVLFANAMGWDPAKGEMYEGSVTYTKFDAQNGLLANAENVTCTQMEFLQLLIYGWETDPMTL